MMDIFVRWYAISIGGLVALPFIFQFRRFGTMQIYTCIRFWLLKNFVYPLLLPRWLDWTRVTIGQAVALAAYATINGFLMIPWRSSSDLMSRCGMLASVNIVPLFLGGRTSFLAEFLGLQLHTYYLAHHWIGRMVVLQGLLHTTLAITSVGQSTDTSGIWVILIS